MGEVVNVLVAFAVIVFLFRWATSSNDTPEQQTAINALGFRPKKVTQDMVTTISNMFPDIPADNIRYDLLRTGSVEQTTNKILERGYLDAPPAAYHTLYPQTQAAAPVSAPATTSTNTSNTNLGAGSASGSTSKKPAPSLIARYNLQDLVKETENGKGKAVASSGQDLEDPFKAGGKAVWEDTPEKREESLRQRKAQMVLAARQRFLSQQKEKEAAAAGKSS
ncbi:hypothetical protein JR316_0011520 [Psilocybe cubensis]|uniref:CUE domain-containing protein n=2 Tax=Psilocybe cubensis TaxID=181762 RepID=A0A8H8CJN3_PSICU|nr:hypothetical protein JR316_0011520 [Psilocybe cubensis]KAH9475955.1 hypothetical protein JR316_0011520 [Psilocybe cubensis]